MPNLPNFQKLRGVDLDPRFSRLKIPKPQQSFGYPGLTPVGC